MKIGILGAGALGRVYGAYLSKNNDVTFIVRNPEQYHALNESGLFMEDEKESLKFKVSAIVNGSSSDIKDIIFIFTKGYDTESALESALSMVGDDTIIVSLQNGMGNHEVISRYANPKNIVMGTSAQGAYITGVNSVCYAGKGVDHLGVMPGGDKSNSEIIRKLLNEAGFRVELEDDILSFIWFKLFVNAASNCVTALLEAKNYILTENEFVKNIVAKILTESVLVANASGMSFDIEDVMERCFSLLEGVKANKTSMYQDIEKGRKTEIDTINGAIIKRAHELKIDVPINEMMYYLIKAKESMQ